MQENNCGRGLHWVKLIVSPLPICARSYATSLGELEYIGRKILSVAQDIVLAAHLCFCLHIAGSKSLCFYSRNPALLNTKLCSLFADPKPTSPAYQHPLLPVMFFIHKVVSCSECYQVSIIRWCRYRHGPCAAHVSMAELVS